MLIDGPNDELRRRFKEQFEACERVLDFARDKLEDWSGRPLAGGTADVLIAAEAARGTKTYRAGLLLASAGFGQQALMMGRSLFEGMLVIHWAAENPEKAMDLYDKHSRHTRLLLADKITELGWEEVAINATPEERKRLDGLFGKTGRSHGRGSPRTRCAVPSNISGRTGARTYA